MFGTFTFIIIIVSWWVESFFMSLKKYGKHKVMGEMKDKIAIRNTENKWKG